MFDPFGRRYWCTESILHADYTSDWWEERRHECDPDQANLIGSLTTRSQHAPALDLDLPAFLEPLIGKYSLLTIEHHLAPTRFRRLKEALLSLDLVGDYQAHPWPALEANSLAIVLKVPAYLLPSSTVGHHHLYLNRQLDWRDYRFLLRALWRCGLIERGFYELSTKRGQSFLRAPGVTKQNEAAALAPHNAGVTTMAAP